MNEFRLRAKNTLWLGWPVLALVVAVAFPLTAPAADRMVLCEEFTATG